jgi:hypothetical protein
MTTTNLRPADALRAALKSAGFNARRVSVRHDHSTLRVTVRDPSASLTQVKAIAAPFESVRHCQVTGEILSGGNTFLSCEYSDALVEPIKVAIAKVLDAAPQDEMVTVIGDFRAAKVSRERGATYPDEVRIEGPSFDYRNHMACGAHWAAERIAVAYLDTRALASDAAHGSATVAIPA